MIKMDFIKIPPIYFPSFPAAIKATEEHLLLDNNLIPLVGSWWWWSISDCRSPIIRHYTPPREGVEDRVVGGMNK